MSLKKSLHGLFKKRKPKVGIIFPGGGLRTAIQATAAQKLFGYLRRAGMPVIYLGGASGGGLNAAVIAQSKDESQCDEYCEGLIETWTRINKDPEKVFPLSELRNSYQTLVEMWKDLSEETEKSSFAELKHWAKILFTKKPDFKKILRTASGESLFSIAPLYDLIDGKSYGIAPLNCHAIVQSSMLFDVFAWAEPLAPGPHPKRNRAFSNRDDAIVKNPGLLRNAVAGSAAIPPFFPAVPFNGFSLVDSGIIDYERAVDAGCEVIFVLRPHFVHIRDESNSDWLKERLYRASIFRAMGVVPSYIDYANEQAQEYALRHAIRLGKQPPLIIVMTLGAPTKTFLVHTCAEGDIDWALRLGKSQMEHHIFRLSQCFEAMRKQKEPPRCVFENPPHDSVTPVLA